MQIRWKVKHKTNEPNPIYCRCRGIWSQLQNSKGQEQIWGNAGGGRGRNQLHRGAELINEGMKPWGEWNYCKGDALPATGSWHMVMGSQHLGLHGRDMLATSHHQFVLLHVYKKENQLHFSTMTWQALTRVICINVYVIIIGIIVAVTNCSLVVHLKTEVTPLQLYPRSKIRAKKVLLWSDVIWF